MNEQELERSRILARLDRIFEIQNETGDPDEWAECDPDAHNILLDEKRLRTRLAELDAPMIAWADNPQAAQIDALIGRAGRLTEAEVDALGAARGAALGAALDSAWGAARGAARGAAWYAAEGAAWGAAWGAAGDAAGDAAWYAAGAAADVADALVVRDLIDEATPWNQAAYDLLVAPWAAVIGPAHPEDVVRR